MIKVLWVVGGVAFGFVFHKLVTNFAEFVLQAIKKSEEDR
jgi:hypothetical protein